jgi:hypothetical protein
VIISGVDFDHNPAERRAQVARKWFAENGPSDMQPLPLGYGERERLKDGSPHHIVTWYARSLADQELRRGKASVVPRLCLRRDGFAGHPSAMAESPELLRRFPPRPLEGLDSHLYWQPPEPTRRLPSSTCPTARGRVLAR